MLRSVRCKIAQLQMSLEAAMGAEQTETARVANDTSICSQRHHVGLVRLTTPSRPILDAGDLREGARGGTPSGRSSVTTASSLGCGSSFSNTKVRGSQLPTGPTSSLIRSPSTSSSTGYGVYDTTLNTSSPCTLKRQCPTYRLMCGTTRTHR